MEVSGSAQEPRDEPASSLAQSHFDVGALEPFAQGQKTILIDYSGVTIDLISALQGPGFVSSIRFGVLPARTTKAVPKYWEDIFKMPEDPADFNNILNLSHDHLAPSKVLVWLAPLLDFWEAKVRDSACPALIVGLRKACEEKVQSKIIQVLSCATREVCCSFEVTSNLGLPNRLYLECPLSPLQDCLLPGWHFLSTAPLPLRTTLLQYEHLNTRSISPHEREVHLGKEGLTVYLVDEGRARKRPIEDSEFEARVGHVHSCRLLQVYL